MTEQAVGGAKMPLFGGRKPLFTQAELLKLTGPLLIEQLLEVTVGMADTMMVSRCGEAAISGVSLVDMINNLIIVLFAALATGGAVVVSQFLGAKEQKNADKSAGQLILLSGLFGLLVGAVCFLLARPMIRLFYGSIDADVLEAGVLSGAEQPDLLCLAPEPGDDGHLRLVPPVGHSGGGVCVLHSHVGRKVPGAGDHFAGAYRVQLDTEPKKAALAFGERVKFEFFGNNWCKRPYMRFFPKSLLHFARELAIL